MTDLLQTTFESMKRSMTIWQSPDSANKKAYEGKAIVNLWSSLSEETHEMIEAHLADFGSQDVTLFRKRDEPLHRNPFNALDYGKAATGGQQDRSIRKQLRRAVGDKAEIFSVVPVDGAGMIAVRAADPFKELSIEASTEFLVGTPNPREHERVCRAINLATINPRKRNQVFVTKADHDEDQAYPRALAHLVLTHRWVDSTNTFSRAATHREIDPSGIAQTRQAIESALLDMRLEFGSPPTELFGFDPEVFVGDTSDITVWAEDQYEAYVRVPEQYQDTSVTEGLGSDVIDVKAKSAPVDSVHIVLTRQVSAEFVDRARTYHLQWLYENADKIDHWKRVVESEYGWQADPQEKVEWLVRRGLGVQHPTVTRVFDQHNDSTHELTPATDGSTTKVRSDQEAE